MTINKQKEITPLNGLRKVITKKVVNQLMDPKTGEVFEVLQAGEEKVIDSLPFVKVYYEMLAFMVRTNCQATIKLSLYIMNDLEYKDSYVYLRSSEVCKDLGWKTKGPFYKAVKGLIEACVIARTEIVNLYYVNPNMVFNGNRIKK
jgi:hypothetical protein